MNIKKTLMLAIISSALLSPLCNASDENKNRTLAQNTRADTLRSNLESVVNAAMRSMEKNNTNMNTSDKKVLSTLLAEARITQAY